MQRQRERDIYIYTHCTRLSLGLKELGRIFRRLRRPPRGEGSAQHGPVLRPLFGTQNPLGFRVQEGARGAGHGCVLTQGFNGREVCLMGYPDLLRGRGVPCMAVGKGKNVGGCITPDVQFFVCCLVCSWMSFNCSHRTSRPKNILPAAF